MYLASLLAPCFKNPLGTLQPSLSLFFKPPNSDESSLHGEDYLSESPMLLISHLHRAPIPHTRHCKKVHITLFLNKRSDVRTKVKSSWSILLWEKTFIFLKGASGKDVIFFMQAEIFQDCRTKDVINTVLERNTKFGEFSFSHCETGANGSSCWVLWFMLTI